MQRVWGCLLGAAAVALALGVALGAAVLLGASPGP